MKQLAKTISGAVLLFLAGAGVMGFVEAPNADQSASAASAPQVINGASGLVDLTKAAETSVNAVVYIRVTTNSKTKTVEVQDPFSDFFGDFFGFGPQQRQIQTPKREGSGSGVIISSDGYIVTNNHVVSGADELLVKLNDNREFKARIIGTDEQTDLALIKIEGKDFPTLPIGNSDELKIGEWVLAVGNPFNLTSTVTAGIVSAKARSLGANTVESFIQTDAAINRGNSGGALVNQKGELVGINAMLYSQTGSYSGYGFAIPTTLMNKVVSDLKEFGVVQRALLGVRGTDVLNYIDSEKSKGNEVDLGTVSGVYIADVDQNSTGEEAGLKKGDVIVAIDGKDVSKMAELQEIVFKKRPGEKVKITYLRDKKKHESTAVLRNQQGTTNVMKEMDMDIFGAVLKPLDKTTMEQLRLPYGLEVAAVKKGKMSDAGVTKGLIILMVNDKPMRNVSDFEDAVREANKSSDRILWLKAITQSGIYKSMVIELDDNDNKKK